MEESKRERKNRLQNLARQRRIHTGVLLNRGRKEAVTKKFLMDNCSVNPKSGCWEWQRNKVSDGYGKVRHIGVTERAHRVSWMLWNGTIPDGMCVLHKCDNPPCCNPDHLFLGTRADNRRDCAMKERDDFKLSKAQVSEIVKTHGRLREIASIFGVSESTIHKIKHGMHTRCRSE